MNDKPSFSEYPQEGHYQTGSTQPPKSHKGLIAFLLVCVIFLSGITTALGVMNIRLFRRLNSASGTTSIHVLEGTPNRSDFFHFDAFSSDITGEAGAVLGITGHTLSSFDRMVYHLPEGIYITTVKDDSDAAIGGILPGDVLVSFNSTPVSDSKSLLEALSACRPGARICLDVYRDGQHFSVVITPDNQQ